MSNPHRSPRNRSISPTISGPAQVQAGRRWQSSAPPSAAPADGRASAGRATAGRGDRSSAAGPAAALVASVSSVARPPGSARWRKPASAIHCAPSDPAREAVAAAAKEDRVALGQGVRPEPRQPPPPPIGAARIAERASRPGPCSPRRRRSTRDRPGRATRIPSRAAISAGRAPAAAHRQQQRRAASATTLSSSRRLAGKRRACRHSDAVGRIVRQAADAERSRPAAPAAADIRRRTGRATRPGARR